MKKSRFSDAQIIAILKRLDKAVKNKAKLTHITDKKSLSTEDKIKLSLCKHFVQYANENRKMAIDLHKLTNIPISRISEITSYKIKNFRLINFSNILMFWPNMHLGLESI